jgi:hypothetical protein
MEATHPALPLLVVVVACWVDQLEVESYCQLLTWVGQVGQVGQVMVGKVGMVAEVTWGGVMSRM